MILILCGILGWLTLFKCLRGTSTVPYRIRGGGGGETTSTSHTYYYYKIKFPHNSLDPNQEIIFYDALGTIVYTLPANYEFMNYGEGVLSVPGTEQNTVVESISTATYYVFYSTDDLIIDYENAEFKISKNILRSVAQSTVTATYEYLTVITPLRDVASVIDGRWDTQVQSVFYSEPASGYNYAILDLGATKTIQALDIVSGFFKPDEYRKYDIKFSVTLNYSTDGSNYYDISDKARNLQFAGGEAISLEEQDLGIGFQARYIKVIVESVDKINYGQRKDSTGTVIQEGVWVIAFTEIGAYDNIVLKSEITLIPTTYLSQAITVTGLSSGAYPETIYVDSTEGFDASGTAYIDNGDGTFDTFTYTGTTATTFTGVAGLSADHAVDDMIVESLETDTTYYDYSCLLPKLKDRVYKANKIDDNMLFTQTQSDYVGKMFLKEFNKNHSKMSIDVIYAPHLNIGQTIEIIDTYNNTNANYFIDAINDNNGFYSLTVARYP